MASDRRLTDARRRLREAAARRLLAVAVTAQTELKRRLNVSNPRPHKTPSKPGEWPKKRTGWGQGHVFYQPSTLGEVVNTLSVRLGYGVSAAYMLYLSGQRLKRKGLKDLLREIRPLLAKLQVRGDVTGGS